MKGWGWQDEIVGVSLKILLEDHRKLSGWELGVVVQEGPSCCFTFAHLMM